MWENLGLKNQVVDWPMPTEINCQPRADRTSGSRSNASNSACISMFLHASTCSRWYQHIAVGLCLESFDTAIPKTPTDHLPELSGPVNHKFCSHSTRHPVEPPRGQPHVAIQAHRQDLGRTIRPDSAQVGVDEAEGIHSENRGRC